MVAQRVGRDDRRQVPDPRVRRGRDRSRRCRCSTRSRRARSSWATPRPTTTSARIPRSPSAPRCCFGMNTRQQNAWWYFGGGERGDGARCSASTAASRFLAGNTGCQMGGWYRKEIKSVADLKGLKMRIGGMAGLVLAKLGVVPQQIGAPRHLSGAGERHDRRGRVGRSVRRREARLQQGRQVLLLPGLLGRRADADDARQREEVERAAQDLPGGAAGRVRRGQRMDAGEVRRAESAGAAPARCGRHAAAAVPARRCWRRPRRRPTRCTPR